MTAARLSGRFIAGAKGPIFVLSREPPGPARGCVLVVPPFAEEMNKCRRMVTEAAIALAGRGIATVVPDLYGTGDSAGDFEDADWATWASDLGAAARWAAESGLALEGYLAIRLGAALAMQAIRDGQLPGARRTVLWQPVFDGGRFLQQFLRLRIAAGMMEDRRETLAELKARLAGGTPVEVAGYSLSPRLAADLEAVAPLDRWPAGCGEVRWIEVVREAAEAVPDPVRQRVAAAADAGARVDAMPVAGEPYWSSTEIVVNAEVVSRTLDHLGPGTPSGAAAP